MITSEALKDVEELAEKYNLVLGSIGFTESGDLEKVYLYKSRAVKSPSGFILSIPRGEASAIIESFLDLGERFFNLWRLR